MCVCVPRPVDSVAPQGRRLRIARGGSGWGNGSTGCTVWDCVGVCAQKVKCSPTPCSAQLGSTPLTPSCPPPLIPSWCYNANSFASDRKHLSLSLSNTPPSLAENLREGHAAILPSSCHVVTIRSKYKKTLCNLCDVSTKILGLRNWYPRKQIGINAGISLRVKESAEGKEGVIVVDFFASTEILHTCLVDHILTYVHIHLYICTHPYDCNCRVLIGIAKLVYRLSVQCMNMHERARREYNMAFTRCFLSVTKTIQQPKEHNNIERNKEVQQQQQHRIPKTKHTCTQR